MKPAWIAAVAGIATLAGLGTASAQVIVERTFGPPVYAYAPIYDYAPAPIYSAPVVVAPPIYAAPAPVYAAPPVLPPVREVIVREPAPLLSVGPYYAAW